MVILKNNMAFTPTVKPLGSAITPPVSPQSQPNQPTDSVFKPTVKPLDNGTMFANLQAQNRQDNPPPSGWWESLKSGASTIASSAYETVAQPARALQQLGTGLGEAVAQNVHLPGEQWLSKKLGFTKENAPAFQQAMQQNPLYGEAKPVKNAEEATGVGIQAAANLATPFVKNPLGMGIQGALLSGGKAMQEDKSASDVAIEGATGGLTSAALGKFTNVAGKVLSKGTQALRQELQPVVQKVFPFLTNVGKSETSWALKNADRVVPKLRTMLQAAESGDTASAESALRQEVADHATKVTDVARQYASQKYEQEAEQVAQKFAGEKGSKSALQDTLSNIENDVGPSLTQDEASAVNGVRQILDQHQGMDVIGMAKLRQKLFSVLDRTEEGSSAHRIATKLWNEVGDQLDTVTHGEMKPINAEYAKFKNSMDQVRPLWSSRATEDARRNFASSLENQTKGGALDALKHLESIGNMEKGGFAAELKASRIARMMNLEKAPAGSRMRDTLVSAIFGGGGAAAGSLFGPAGTFVGGTTGAALGTKMTSPRLLSQYLFDEMEKQGGKVPGAVRQWLGEKIADPRFAQLLMRIHQQPNSDESNQVPSQQ